MSADDGSNKSRDRGASGGDVRGHIERETGRAFEQFDDGVVDLLSWILDTETRARIYVQLHQQPRSTSAEIAEGTGLYPSTVREALAGLHEDGTVTRSKRKSGGAGNNPYEYSAIPPSELVADVVGDVQEQLNAVCNLGGSPGDGGTDDRGEGGGGGGGEPVTITVERDA